MRRRGACGPTVRPMTTTRIARTITALAGASAAVAFAAPAADAKPLEPPATAPPLPVHHASAVAHGSTGFGWAEAAIAVATIVVLIGLAALGARTANRSTVEA